LVLSISRIVHAVKQASVAQEKKIATMGKMTSQEAKE